MDIDDQRLEIRATNSCHEMIFFKKGLEVILMRRLGYTNLVVNIERWAPVRQLIALNGISATKQLLSISESVVVGSGCLHDDVVEHGKFSVKLELWRWHPASGHGILVRGRPIEPKILSSARIQIQGQSLERKIGQSYVPSCDRGQQGRRQSAAREDETWAAPGYEEFKESKLGFLFYSSNPSNATCKCHIQNAMPKFAIQVQPRSWLNVIL
jgi:hypothetical protein